MNEQNLKSGFGIFAFCGLINLAVCAHVLGTVGFVMGILLEAAVLTGWIDEKRHKNSEAE